MMVVFLLSLTGLWKPANAGYSPESDAIYYFLQDFSDGRYQQIVSLSIWITNNGGADNPGNTRLIYEGCKAQVYEIYDAYFSQGLNITYVNWSQHPVDLELLTSIVIEDLQYTLIPPPELGAIQTTNKGGHIVYEWQASHPIDCSRDSKIKVPPLPSKNVDQGGSAEDFIEEVNRFLENDYYSREALADDETPVAETPELSPAYLLAGLFILAVFCSPILLFLSLNKRRRNQTS